ARREQAARAAQGNRGEKAAARGAHPRRQGRALRVRRPRRVRLPARRHPQGRFHHGASAAERRLGKEAIPMAMSLGGKGPAGEPEVMLDINTTPLIDVMLVLIIMLIITIPIQTHAVKLNMPVGTPPPPLAPPEVVTIEVDFDGTLIWNGQVLASRKELEPRLRAAAAQPVQ